MEGTPEKKPRADRIPAGVPGFSGTGFPDFNVWIPVLFFGFIQRGNIWYGFSPNVWDGRGVSFGVDARFTYDHTPGSDGEHGVGIG